MAYKYWRNEVLFMPQSYKGWTATKLIAFEKEIADIYLMGKIHAPIHLSGGNEEQLLRIFKEIKTDDWCFATYRSHYHALLKGCPKA